MKAHKYWSLGALACMAGCFYTGCKKLMQAHKYFACGFQPFPIFSPNVHIATAENGTIISTFSMHSVVSFCSPFTVSQMLQPSITLDNGFIHRFRFNNVRNRIREVTKAKKNNFLKNILSLNSLYHVTIAFFQPFPASIGL